MTTTVGTNSYSSDAELMAYADSRGLTLSGVPSVLLIKAMDWLEIQPFKGEKTDPEQPLEFPRNGETQVPERIKTAQIVAALIYDAGGDPMAAIDRRVVREKVDVVEVQYSDKGNQTTLYPQLSMLLRGFLSASGGSTFKVERV